MLLLSVATSNIYADSGPTEVVLGSHKKKIPYLDFLFMKKIKKKVLLSLGDVVIRHHSLWHRGTKNNSNEARFLIVFLLFEKKRKMIKKSGSNNKLYFFDNFFKNNFIGRIKEIIYVHFKILFVAYKIFMERN